MTDDANARIDLALQLLAERDQAARDLEALTMQQSGALRHQAQGLTNKQIARRMGIDHKTVEHHLLQARKRMNRKTYGLIVLAAKAGWA